MSQSIKLNNDIYWDQTGVKDLAVVNNTYTPTITWTDGSTAPTIDINDFRYMSYGGHVYWISGRFRITNLGTPGSSAHLQISLPSVILNTASYGACAVGVVYCSDAAQMSTTSGDFLIRKYPDYLCIVRGAQGNPSASYFTTGYYVVSAMFIV